METNRTAPAEIFCTILAAKMPGFASTGAGKIPFQYVHKDWEITAVDGANVYMDGDQWCALIGENLQEGVAGFGATPSEAMHDLISHLEFP